MPKVAISLARASGSMLRGFALSSCNWWDKAAGSGGQVAVLKGLSGSVPTRRKGQYHLRRGPSRQNSSCQIASGSTSVPALWYCRSGDMEPCVAFARISAWDVVLRSAALWPAGKPMASLAFKHHTEEDATAVANFSTSENRRRANSNMRRHMAQ